VSSRPTAARCPSQLAAGMGHNGLDAAQPMHTELLTWVEATLQAERCVLAADLEQRHADLLQGLKTKLATSFSSTAAELPLHVEDVLSDRAVLEATALPGCVRELPTAFGPKTGEDCAALDVAAVPGKVGEPTTDEAGQCLKGVRPEWEPDGAIQKKIAVLNYAQEQVQNFITDDAPAALLHVTQTGHSWPCLWWLERLVASAKFELVFIMLILLNTIIMAAEVQYRGTAAGPPLGYPGHMRSPESDTQFEVLEWIFGVVFFIEVIVRLAALRGSFLFFPFWEQEHIKRAPAAGNVMHHKLQIACSLLLHVDWWNLLDLVIVLAWLATALGDTSLPLDPMLLRLARLGRLMRLLRLVRTIQGLDALYLLTATLKSSMMALFWSIVLLLVIQLLSALALNQLLEKYYTDTTQALEQRQAVYKYFGTFTRALFTASELTLGGYGTMARTLIEHVSEWWAIFFILHRGAVGFAIVTVIRGVIITETLRVAAQDDVVLLSHKTTAKELHRQKMERLFALVDADGSDIIEVDEFRRACKNPVLQTWLQSLELDVRDADMVYKAIAGPDSDCLTKTDLILGMAKLKGPARSMEMAIFKEEMRDMMRDIHISLVHNKLVT